MGIGGNQVIQTKDASIVFMMISLKKPKVGRMVLVLLILLYVFLKMLVYHGGIYHVLVGVDLQMKKSQSHSRRFHSSVPG